MAIDRPTFSESWYRVATMRPRLRSTVQTYRQHYRGQTWHVVRDPGNNNFFRLTDSAYHFVGLLDGNRTVEQVWQICNDQLGDHAPTQSEAIELLGQLYTSNLLAAELAADALGMFDRYKHRVRREVGSYMQNLLFIRIPLIDPDAFLDRWVGIFGLLFTKTAWVIWFIILGIGLAALSGRWGDLIAAGSSENILAPENLGWLYVAFAFDKLLHEFGHGFACKKFGRDAHSGGEVHTMGIMFLVFMPVPYVDASSSWALRSKWQRMVVGAGGIYVELALASIAAVIWANTAPGNLAHELSFRVMFIASLSTLVFNGNPLLRFDAYYILSDILEIANLNQRSKDYLYYLVKRYVYGVRRPRNPAHSGGERFWLTGYGLASFVYRIFVYLRIMMYVADKFFIIGALLAIVGLVTWVVRPVGKWIHYLWTSPELLRTRSRAVMSTACFFLAIFVVVGVLQMDEHDRAEGVIEAREYIDVYMPENGFVDTVLASDQQVDPDGEPLLTAHNEELELEVARKRAEVEVATAQLDIARSVGSAEAMEAAEGQLEASQSSLAKFERRAASLRLAAPITGTWVAWEMEQVQGAFLRKGDRIGQVVNLNEYVIRAVTDQALGPRLFAAADTVDIRVKGRPDMRFDGTIEQVYPSGDRQLPHQAMRQGVGGTMQTDPSDNSGTRTTEQFFQVRIGDLRDAQGDRPGIYPGQRVVLRFNLGPRPLIVQWVRKVRQLVQRRFHTTL